MELYLLSLVSFHTVVFKKTFGEMIAQFLALHFVDRNLISSLSVCQELRIMCEYWYWESLERY
jgi:hypothetical protein